MEILGSARKHGIAEEDILHAWRNPVHARVGEYDGEERVFVIGPDRTGDLLEIVAVPGDEPQRIIHADRLRPDLYRFLR